MIEKLKKAGLWAVAISIMMILLLTWSIATGGAIDTDNPTIDQLEDEKVDNVKKFTDSSENTVCYVYNESISCVTEEDG